MEHLIKKLLQYNHDPWDKKDFLALASLTSNDADQLILRLQARTKDNIALDEIVQTNLQELITIIPKMTFLGKPQQFKISQNLAKWCRLIDDSQDLVADKEDFSGEKINQQETERVFYPKDKPQVQSDIDQEIIGQELFFQLVGSKAVISEREAKYFFFLNDKERNILYERLYNQAIKNKEISSSIQINLRLLLHQCQVKDPSKRACQGLLRNWKKNLPDDEKSKSITQPQIQRIVQEREKERGQKGKKTISTSIIKKKQPSVIGNVLKTTGKYLFYGIFFIIFLYFFSAGKASSSDEVFPLMVIFGAALIIYFTGEKVIKGVASKISSLLNAFRAGRALKATGSLFGKAFFLSAAIGFLPLLVSIAFKIIQILTQSKPLNSLMLVFLVHVIYSCILFVIFIILGAISKRTIISLYSGVEAFLNWIIYSSWVVFFGFGGGLFIYGILNTINQFLGIILIIFIILVTATYFAMAIEETKKAGFKRGGIFYLFSISLPIIISIVI